MKKYHFLVLIILISSCKGTKKQIITTKEFEKTIEQSIISLSESVNPIIKEFNYIIQDNRKANKLDSLYKNAKKIVAINEQIVELLDEKDDEIKLKKKMKNYLKETKDFLDNGIYPLMEFYKVNNETFLTAKEIKPIFISFRKIMEESERMSNNLEVFCKKHNIEMGLDKFDKSKYNGKVQEVLEIIKTKN